MVEDMIGFGYENSMKSKSLSIDENFENYSESVMKRPTYLNVE